MGDGVMRPDPPLITVNDDDTGEIFLICAEVDILARILPENCDALDTPDIKEEETKETGCSGGEVYINLDS